MRLQLTLLFGFMMSLAIGAEAQSPDSLQRKKRPVDVDFLFSYYDQDGVHSAVTGGTGTEKLHDVAGKMILHIPVDTVTQLGVTTMLNHYSSASSDMINSQMSSASRNDFHVEAHFDYSKTNTRKRRTVGVLAGASNETDYNSANIGVYLSQQSRNLNREWLLKAQAYFDGIMVIFPEELRGTGGDVVGNDKRQTFLLSATLSQVINKRLQASFTVESVLQRGLLSTPFHRVYFRGVRPARLEHLPDNRFKLPVSMRLHWFPMDLLVLRSQFRLYTDSWGITAATASAEVPLKIAHWLSIYPFYRFHIQQGTRYFAPFDTHTGNPEFFTSDYDLSSFHSHKYGAGLQLAPARGISRFALLGLKNQFRSLDLRYAMYRRSDGLHAWIVALGMEFELW